MKRLLTVICVALFSASVSTAYAEDSRMYAGIGVGMLGIEYKEPGLDINQNNPAMIAYFGVDYNEYLGVEVRVGGSTDGDSTVGATKVELSASLVSLLAKMQYPVAQDFSVYALVGGTSATLNRKQTTLAGAVLIDDKATKASVSFGAGAKFSINEQMSLGAEWMQYWTKTNVGTNISAKIWGAGANFTYHF